MTKNSSDDPRILFDLFREITMIAKFSSSEFQRVLGPELGESEFGVLSHLVRVENDVPVAPSRLAALFQVTRPSMTAIISNLAAKGFVDISSSEVDRRQKLIKITKAGRKAHAKGEAQAAPLLVELAGLIDPNKLKNLLPDLHELRTVLDTHRNEKDGLG